MSCHIIKSLQLIWRLDAFTVYPKKYAHGFVVLCFVVVMQSFIMNSHEVFIHIHQGCFAGTGAIARLPQCQWSKPDGYGKISQCITTTKHSKAKTVCIFLGIYCRWNLRASDIWTICSDLTERWGTRLTVPVMAVRKTFYHMMTSSDENIFRVTGSLWGEFTGPRWIPLTKDSDSELWCFPWSAHQQTVE